MYKLIETVEAASPGRAAGLAPHLLTSVAQALAGVGRLERFAINVVDVEPASVQQAPHSYVAVIEYWFAEELEGVVEALESAWAAAPTTAALRHWRYHVSERIQLGAHNAAGSGERSPGVKALYLVRRPDGLSNDTATKGWRQHANTARTHHVGMSRYIQNGVIETLSTGAPVIHGIAELSFPTLEDLEQRMYGSNEGREAISREASALVGEVVALYTSEYVFGRATR